MAKNISSPDWLEVGPVTKRKVNSTLGAASNRTVLNGSIMNEFHVGRCLKQTVGLVLVIFVVSGCASRGVSSAKGSPVKEMRPDERGKVVGTGIESQDLVAVTDKMARSILNVPEIASAKTVPRVILEKIENDTRFAIKTQIFLSRIRVQLNSKAGGKVRFLARENMAALENERALKQTGQVTSASDPNVVEFKGADYILTGKLEGLTTKTSKGTSDYVLYSFRLVDARTTEIVWEDSAEMKKEGLEDAAYR